TWVEYGGQKKNLMIMAADAEDASVFYDSGMLKIDEGRELQTNDPSGVMIGASVKNNVFDEIVDLRKTLTIGGMDYKVVGTLKQEQTVPGDQSNQNDVIFMSTDGLRRIVSDPSPLYIIALANTPENTALAAEEVEDYFIEKYGKRSVTVLSSEKILDMINQVYGIITLFLVGIAGISIVVGGIGIANAMIAAVIERTKEIGLLKALGASNSMIASMFMLEAGFIGLIGGIIGLISGYGLSSIVAISGTAAGFAIEAAITPEITLGAMAFSLIVGMGAGYFPALRAANLDPVDALRYE
ncbi:MAG: ABC transporter permease, partial [archaeon]